MVCFQGYGLFTLEELRYSPSGYLYTRGPGFYKIPGFGDIPVEFNVSLLKGASNPKAVYSSKVHTSCIYSWGITVLFHFRKDDLMIVIICKNDKYLLKLYSVIFSKMTGILSHLSYIFH